MLAMSTHNDVWRFVLVQVTMTSSIIVSTVEALTSASLGQQTNIRITKQRSTIPSPPSPPPGCSRYSCTPCRHATHHQQQCDAYTHTVQPCAAVVAVATELAMPRRSGCFVGWLMLTLCACVRSSGRSVRALAGDGRALRLPMQA